MTFGGFIISPVLDALALRTTGTFFHLFAFSSFQQAQQGTVEDRASFKAPSPTFTEHRASAPQGVSPHHLVLARSRLDVYCPGYNFQRCRLPK